MVATRPKLHLHRLVMPLARKRAWTLDSWTTGLGTFRNLRRWTPWVADRARKISPEKRISYRSLRCRRSQVSQPFLPLHRKKHNNVETSPSIHDSTPPTTTNGNIVQNVVYFWLVSLQDEWTVFHDHRGCAVLPPQVTEREEVFCSRLHRSIKLRLEAKDSLEWGIIPIPGKHNLNLLLHGVQILSREGDIIGSWLQ